MQPFTLNQAAKACNKSNSAILADIRSGKLFAVRNELKQWQIEQSELFRAYPSGRSPATEPPPPDQPPAENKPTAVSLKNTESSDEKFKAFEIERERERQYMQATIDDLRRRLDDEAQERRKLTALLISHQPRQKSEQAESLLFQKLFGRREF